MLPDGEQSHLVAVAVEDRQHVGTCECKAVRDDAGDVTAHTLRHGVARRMLRAKDGNTLYDARNRPRHAMILTTERAYDHFETV